MIKSIGCWNLVVSVVVIVVVVVGLSLGCAVSVVGGVIIDLSEVPGCSAAGFGFSLRAAIWQTKWVFLNSNDLHRLCNFFICSSDTSSLTVGSLHSQKRHRLVASCQLYRLHQVATSLLNQACCNLLKQLAASLWITSLDKSVRTTCDKLVESTMLLQVVKTDLLQVDIIKPASSCWNNL